MKVHYINILLFAHALNILAHNTNKPSITTPYTPKIPTTRLLCECELYAPVNYDNDPQMKEVMQQFEDRTSQRFHEYDKHMIEKRKQCKEQCDKEIQKIILKDKLEKELMDKFVTLHTDIQSDAIPTCVCEKSLADKTEKFCLNCGKTMGGVAYGWGLVGNLMYTGWTHYVPIAIAKAGIDAGMEVVRFALEKLGVKKLIPVICKKISSIKDFSNVTIFTEIIQTELKAIHGDKPINMAIGGGKTITTTVEDLVKGASNQIVDKAPGRAQGKALEVAGNYASTTSSLNTGISASIIAIVVIVVIMVIIYLILRRRRKKKMKKKLQYIKLLEE